MLFSARPRIADDLSQRGVPSDTLIWAIGDVHGQADLLACLTRAIVTDLGQSACRRRILLLVGDYVDRGLQSREVIQHVLDLEAEMEAEGGEVVCLKGNHEELLLRFLEDSTIGPDWAALGGKETLISYGVEPPPLGARSDQWQRASTALLEHMPKHHLEFLRCLHISVTLGDFHFVHAGVRPGVPLEQQTEADALWIRDAFLADEAPLPKVVVHGHTPVHDVHVDHRRICIDTGAYATGVLSALRLENRTRMLMCAERKGRELGLSFRRL